MGFNYAREKREFMKEWARLRCEYQAVGMSEETIKKLYAFDWEWFCSRRSFCNHSQELPVEHIDEVSEQSRSNLINKFDTMRTEFDESTFDGRFAWVDTIEDASLVDKLKRLSAEDLELLTLIAIDEYSQSELARKTGAVQSVISRKISRIKKLLK